MGGAEGTCYILGTLQPKAVIAPELLCLNMKMAYRDPFVSSSGDPDSSDVDNLYRIC